MGNDDSETARAACWNGSKKHIRSSCGAVPGHGLALLPELLETTRRPALQAGVSRLRLLSKLLGLLLSQRVGQTRVVLRIAYLERLNAQAACSFPRFHLQ
jgi:hypothetical protein